MTRMGDRALSTGAAEILAGGGEMGPLLRAFDWAGTPLGPVDRWSPSLRTMVKMLLVNRFPLLLWWGPDLNQLYNDAYRPVLGAKHPRALGQPARECWPEIWHIIGPLIMTAYTGGPAMWNDDLFLEVQRHGFVEETHFTVAYSPVPDDSVPGGIGGILATVHEITQQVIQERRMALLRDLGMRSSDAKTAEEACGIAAEVLDRHPKDIPFALLYLIEAEQRTARLAAGAGTTMGEAASPMVVALSGEGDRDAPWPLAAVMRTEQALLVEHLRERLGSVPAGPWSDPPDQALVLPVPSTTQHRLAGLLVLGLSARLAVDDAYRSFCALVTGQIATAITNARAYDDERRRAEALAELDRAKTTFFSNVSHEFRTPLTLLLGPLEEALAVPLETPLGKQREQLESAHRNGLRMLRVVNTLLDFARIQAGRIEAIYEPVDLAAETIDLAGVFRSAVEGAGLRLVMECPPLPEPTYVDREMWEKIVLNLLSNAFKFTFDGEIAMTLRQAGNHVELAVRDTGTGIPAGEIPHLFERFHRVRDARGRTIEGTGIGLALVQDLVRLHGGTVSVESTLGEGSTFTVRLPTGTAHLPADRISATRTLVSTALGAAPYVEEALSWVPIAPETAAAAIPAPAGSSVAANRVAPGSSPRACVLVVDDNADMRAYLRRLLEQECDVTLAVDGANALARVRQALPDLVLTDVMLPGLDGFALLRALRADPRSATVPILLLSARAGEEARVEGLEAGADDYLVKPFSASELLARVKAHLQNARLRRLQDEFLAAVSHELQTPLTSIRAGLGLLELGAGDALGPAERKLLATIRSNVERLRLHIADLLAARALQGDAPARDRAALDLRDIVASATSAVQPLVQEKGQSLHLDLPTPLPIMGDARLLEQVVVNLLANAHRHTPAGTHISVTGWVEAAGEEKDTGETVRLVVHDTGPGIPTGELEAVFERFYHEDRQANGAGSGLGLAIARGTVALHGGQLWAESLSGQGATFHLALPHRADEQSEPVGP